MNDWIKAALPLVVLIVGFLGGALLSSKQIDKLQLDALQSAKELGALDEKISNLEKESVERFEEINSSSKAQKSLQDDLEIQINKQLQAVNKQANALVSAQAEIDKLSLALTGENGKKAEARVIALNELLGNQDNANTLTMLNESVSNLDSEISAITSANFLSAAQIDALKPSKGILSSSGEAIEDYQGILPPLAKGAILKVIVNSKASADTSGSFVCSDNNGEFSTQYHYYQNGITSYGDTWAGGTVFCPFFLNQQIKWRTASNQFRDRADSNVKVIFSVVGWY